MHTVGLEDDLTLTLHPGGSGQIALHCNHATLEVDKTNLVYRAAQLVLNQVERPGDLFITLTKRIPLGAGLGGGSSDAAATILGLTRLLNLGWSVERMIETGRELGSDVPFFFLGPAAVVTGRGEQVRPVQVSGSRWMVLVNPGFPVETKWAYQQLSQQRKAVHPISDALVQLNDSAVLDWSKILPLVENDFEPPVFAKHPVLSHIKRQLLNQGAEAALLSGSGATVFGVFSDQIAAERAAAILVLDPNRQVYAVPLAGAPGASMI